MPFSPLMVLSAWFRGLVAVGIIVAGIWLWRGWYDRSQVRTRETVRMEDGPTYTRDTTRLDFHPGFNVATLLLAGAVVTTAWSLGAGLLVSRWTLGRRRGSPKADARADQHRHVEVRLLHREDMGDIYVEIDVPPTAPARDAARPTLVLVHAWGADRTQWHDVRRHLRGAWRIVTWDLPGLGNSSRPKDRDFSVARMAKDLRRVIEGTTASGDRVVLVGHGSGTLVALEFVRLFPELVAARVAGIVLAHGTYTNPLRTIAHAELYTAIQKPLIEPLMYLTIPLSAAVWAMQWLAYLNGSTHWATHRAGFSGNQGRRRLDFATRFALRASPAVLARGTLGLLRSDGTATLDALAMPALLIAGSADPITPSPASEFMRERIPGAEMFVLPDARHLGPMEFDREFALRLAEFTLRRCTATGALVTPPPADRAASCPPAAVPTGGVEDRIDEQKAAPDRADDAARRPAPAR
ncbi:MAG TPA: alpha/beta hydrolase [Tepidisphaeraceae bacterium]|jgi:pimeloyl-ACP methyl ester carboxylesterase